MNDITLPVNRDSITAKTNSIVANRHPVDALADVREQIKSLKEKEENLKSLVSQKMGTRDSLGGDEWIARQAISERAGSLDTKAMERDNIDVGKYRKRPVAVVSIRVERRVMENV